MEIDEIVDYATKSPENTNPAVLRSMLSQLNGGSGGVQVFIVSVTEDGVIWTCDKTWREIADAYDGGKMVRFNLPSYDNASSPLLGLTASSEQYDVYYQYARNISPLSCSNENDYPSASFD